ncbi:MULTISPECIES: RidA family protein [unclassified Anaerobiospirillum]|uniref:RidA family protein n=1 Tax=unclassified Anaerobiospirillum TaxID=2647410 RepID=UPI001FF66E6E|nr:MULTISPECIES: RidA family protein [unclassified Anaerobiospirillum]MCK0535278.1 RidA family protein [Anaerobiospirillum sp. NML120511]MCK0540527.1 RidA family protein [Anaerobiospirillum sp. NML02-A-032]
MSKEVITSANAPKAIGPYSSAISLGNMLFVSGQIPVNPQSGDMPEDIKDQANQSLSNLKALVEEAGFTLADVVKTTVFLADIGDFTAVNEVYSTYFAQPYPTRSCVAVKDLPKGARVEIECICCRS